MPTAKDADAAAKAVAVARKRRDEGDDEGAIKMAEKALRLDPTCEEAIELRTWLVKCACRSPLARARWCQGPRVRPRR
jgi:hypothetical protein